MIPGYFWKAELAQANLLYFNARIRLEQCKLIIYTDGWTDSTHFKRSEQQIRTCFVRKATNRRDSADEIHNLVCSTAHQSQNSFIIFLPERLNHKHPLLDVLSLRLWHVCFKDFTVSDSGKGTLIKNPAEWAFIATLLRDSSLQGSAEPLAHTSCWLMDQVCWPCGKPVMNSSITPFVEKICAMGATLGSPHAIESYATDQGSWGMITRLFHNTTVLFKCFLFSSHRDSLHSGPV